MEKHPCRICSKCFPSGRSLGGHMRSHVCSYTDEAGKKKKKKIEEKVGGSRAGYGLRENPKKLWRVSDLAADDPTSSSSSSLKWKQCRECGRVFPSSKALFGHMRCHSSKICRRSSPTELKQEQGGQEEEQEKFSQESISDNNAPPPAKYEREQEQVAISLMMLSRDLGGGGGGWAPASESSDKHSVVFEEDDRRSEPTDFDCGYSGEGQKRKKSAAVEEEEEEEEKGHCFNAYESNWGKTKSKLENGYECTSCRKSFHSYQALGGHRASHKRIKTCCLQKPSSSFDGSDHEPTVADLMPSCHSNKIRIHECGICKKTFSSGQALGGHKRTHIPPNTTDAGIPAADVPELLDLNFPAGPVDEEFSNVKPWRVVRHEHHHLVDFFISN